MRVKLQNKNSYNKKIDKRYAVIALVTKAMG